MECWLPSVCFVSIGALDADLERWHEFIYNLQGGGTPLAQEFLHLRGIELHRLHAQLRLWQYLIIFLYLLLRTPQNSPPEWRVV